MTTVTKNVKVSGNGLHSGLPVNMVIKPSKKRGIFFKRVDIPNSELIPATFDNVRETMFRSTQIGDPHGDYVRTIEHLMATLFILGIDSAIIEIDAPEVPILDGSAFEWYKILEKVVSDKTQMKKIIVKKTIVAERKDLMKQMPLFKRIKVAILNYTLGRHGDSYMRLSPYDKGLQLDCIIDYNNKAIGTEYYSCILDGSKASAKEFVDSIAKSRSFGVYSEWNKLKKHGMALGSNMHNLIVLNERQDAAVNKLYYPDEFVRHKVIDAIGDMFTSGGIIYGRLESYKGTHELNNFILRKLFSDKSNYEIIEPKGEKNEKNND